jgi:hypothetical protein
MQKLSIRDIKERIKFIIFNKNNKSTIKMPKTTKKHLKYKMQAADSGDQKEDDNIQVVVRI